MRSFSRCMLVTPEDLCFVRAGAATGFKLLHGLSLPFGASRMASRFFATTLIAEE